MRQLLRTLTGRELSYKLGDARLNALTDLETWVKGQQANGADVAAMSIIVSRGPIVTYRKALDACEALNRAGASRIALWPWF